MMTGINYPSQQEKQAAQMQYQQGMQAVQSGQIQPTPELQAKGKELQELIRKPSQEEIIQLIKSDQRGFRVDIESDSTIRGDLQKNQEQMSLFLQGTAQYLGAVGPMVQEGVMPAEVAVEIYAAFCRTFRLGKQAEDAIDRLSDTLKKGDGEQKKPSPEEQKAQAEQQKMAAELQFKQQEHQMKLEQMQAELQMKKEEMALKREELQLKQQEMAVKAQMSQQQAAIDAQTMQQKAVMDQQSMQMQNEHMEREHALGMESQQYKHDTGIEMMAAKAQQAKQRPQARAGR
jgi:hypothetical protein